VREATDEYFADQDTLGQWADEWLEPERDAFVLSRTLFASWKQWCEERNLSAGTETAFTEGLKDRGYQKHRKTSARGFKDIVLKANNAPGLPMGRL